MCADQDLSYYKFWEQLRTRFIRDVRSTHRQNWHMVKVSKAGDLPTLQEWAEFQAAYASKRALVEDWSDAEDQQLVFAQVPREFQKRLLQETGKRREGQKWVRVGVPDGLTNQEIKEELERTLETPMPNCEMEKRHFVVKCATREVQERLMELDGAKLSGKPIKIQKPEYCMTGDEILPFIRKILERDDELRLLRKSYGCPEEENRRHDPRAETQGGIFAVTGLGTPTRTAAESTSPKQTGKGSGNAAGKGAGKGNESKGRSRGRGRPWEDQGGKGNQWDNQASKGNWWENQPAKGEYCDSRAGKGAQWEAPANKGHQWETQWGQGKGKGQGHPPSSPAPAAPTWNYHPWQAQSSTQQPNKKGAFCHVCALEHKPASHEPNT